MKGFKSTGSWWLPGDEANRVAGTLRVSASGNIHLSLLGTFENFSGFGINNSILPVILGEIERSPFGELVTLSRCLVSNSSFGGHSRPRVSYFVTMGFFGAHLSQESDFQFDHLSLRLGGLNSWAESLTGFTNDSFQRKGGSLGSHVMPLPISAVVPEGQVSLGFSMTQSFGRLRRTFEEQSQVSIVCNECMSVDRLSTVFVAPLQNLMTFVSDRAQDVEEFKVCRVGPEGHAFGKDQISVIMSRVQPEEDEEGNEEKDSILPLEMLFTLADFDFEELTKKWMRLTQHYAAACSVYFGLRYDPPVYIDVLFLGTVQAIGLFFSTSQQGMELRGEEELRLNEIRDALPSEDAKWIIDRLGVRPIPPAQITLSILFDEHRAVMEKLVSKRKERFINEVMNTRHFLVHRESETWFAASEGASLYWLTQKLQFLLKACFLSELGCSPERSLELLQRNPQYQHLVKLEEDRELKSFQQNS